jgi:uncharacterized circularly permuted ATP-grasp superfamily protein/uncharacterized alpha-E superfamily protein
MPPTPQDSVHSDQAISPGFAEKYASRLNSTDEMVDPAGAVRPHWQPFLSKLDQMGAQELSKQWEQVRRFVHDNGVSYNVYGDSAGMDRPWSLDLIPLLLPSAEWDQLSAGLIQRARLLDRLLADLYGPAETVFEGLLPPELLWANAGFLRPCHGSNPPQGRWLHLYAADVIRTRDGAFEVLSDRTQAPSGAGYSLENRIVLSRTLSSEFRECNVERLASFFSSLRTTLGSLAPANRENPRIVLLTPGPYNETYFEHSYLARYLGYPLVQGNDLTVRDGNVFIKTVEGLRRVDVILRRVDDDYCDPLELNARSYLGVPGLLQSVRLGHVAVANALGAGVLQAAGFLPFLPALCRRLLDEDLKLPSVPSWWCGDPRSLQYVLDHLPDLVVKSAFPTLGEDPIFGQGLGRDQLGELSQRIRQSPERFVAQQRAISYTAPSLAAHEFEPRHLVIRTYLVAQGDTYSAMRGGLTRIAPSEDSLLVSVQKGGVSKDTWIVSDRPVQQMTLLPSTDELVELSRAGGDLTSRIADDLFWLGRYLERAEFQARLARGTIARITDSNSAGKMETAEILLAALSAGFAGTPTAGLDRGFVEGLLGDPDDGGLRGLISSVHGFARALRDRISLDAGRILQRLFTVVSNFRIDRDDPILGIPELLDNLVERFAGFAGLVSESTTRGQAWRFLDIGRRLERVNSIARFIQATIAGAEGDTALLETVLEVMDSSLTYRRRYLTRLEPHAVADLLLADETNPRGMAFQLLEIDRHLSALPRQSSQPDRERERKILLKVSSAIQLMDMREICQTDPVLFREALNNLMSEVVEQIALLSDVIAAIYFSHAEVSRQLSEMARDTP